MSLFFESASASYSLSSIYNDIPFNVNASGSASASSEISKEDAYKKALDLAKKNAQEKANSNLETILQTLKIQNEINIPETKINYYNSKSLLINVMNNGVPEIPLYGGISAWQGIRDLGSNSEQGTNVYLMVGTTNPSPTTGQGVICIGNIAGINNVLYYLNVPNSKSTSIYGPYYYEKTGLYSFVGSYNNGTSKQYAFYYSGHLNSLNVSSNFVYPSVNNDYEVTFLHSIANQLIVGNSGNINPPSVISYIYDINDLTKIKTQILVPNFPEGVITTYGIWDNGNNTYTIVGGCTLTASTLLSIKSTYNLDLQTPIPYDYGFIMDYDNNTNTFSNFTPIKYKNSLTHFQGISRAENGSYSLNADVVFDDGSVKGYFLKVYRDINNKFIFNEKLWIELNYLPSNLGITSSNSVVNNKVIGLFISNDINTQPNVAYQSEILKLLRF